MPPDGAVTVTLIEPDALPPGFGLLTLTPKVPADASEPVAVSCVAETKVVPSAEPPKETCAPFTKWLPLTVSVNEPAVKVEGLTPLMAGVGFHNVTVLDALTLESCTDVTLTVTLFGLGSVPGAVYAPLGLIIPMAALPPAMPLIAQVTF